MTVVVLFQVPMDELIVFFAPDDAPTVPSFVRSAEDGRELTVYATSTEVLGYLHIQGLPATVQKSYQMVIGLAP